MKSEPGTAVPLKDVLLNRRWALFSEPFRHLIVQDVFNKTFYEKLERAFQSVLNQGFSEDKVDPFRFSRNMDNYDAYGMAIPQGGLFDIFLSQEMHDRLNDIFQLNATGDIAGSLHTHMIGGRNGFIHNDLNPARFPKRKANDKTVFYSPEAYDKAGRAQGANESTVIRALSVIYYLNNEPWSPGDGGETGLYTSLGQHAQQAVVRVPPLNNLLLAFECTPYSFHAFISNQKSPRNSLIFWLHNNFDQAVSRWGRENVVWWDK